jgi:hypothetical protein
VSPFERDVASKTLELRWVRRAAGRREVVVYELLWNVGKIAVQQIVKTEVANGILGVTKDAIEKVLDLVDSDDG